MTESTDRTERLSGKWVRVPVVTVVRPRSLAKHVRLKRGDTSLGDAAKKVGISRSALRRVENGLPCAMAAFVKLSQWVLA